MAKSGIIWIDTVYDWAVHALVWLARLLGITYEEINVWLFCVIWPLITLGLVAGLIILWRKNISLNIADSHIRSINDRLE